MKRFYLILWWMTGVPYAAILEDKTMAESAANVRNALLLEIKCGKKSDINIIDYFKSSKGMPVEWRDLFGQIRMPWGPLARQIQR